MVFLLTQGKMLKKVEVEFKKGQADAVKKILSVKRAPIENISSKNGSHYMVLDYSWSSSYIAGRVCAFVNWHSISIINGMCWVKNLITHMLYFLTSPCNLFRLFVNCYTNRTQTLDMHTSYILNYPLCTWCEEYCSLLVAANKHRLVSCIQLPRNFSIHRVLIFTAPPAHCWCGKR